MGKRNVEKINKKHIRNKRGKKCIYIYIVTICSYIFLYFSGLSYSPCGGAPPGEMDTTREPHLGAGRTVSSSPEATSCALD